MEWRPIETAPKDGTTVLLYSPDAREPQIFVARYMDWENGGAWYDYWAEDGCWAIDSEPTHWIPMPEKPRELNG